ncbi:MAG: hypothetical protein N2439_09800, partial [Anaerolineae bacterium]|nr:hypothetical protein [Anaerolineae bacterium]
TLVGATGVLLGIGTRLSAIGLLIAVGAMVIGHGFQLWHGVLLGTALPLLYTGAGALAIWRGEDALFERRIGERKT